MACIYSNRRTYAFIPAELKEPCEYI